MLILARKLNENIVINGNIVVKVVRIDRDQVKLGIMAPPNVAVDREEIHKLKEDRRLMTATSERAGAR